MTNKEESSKAGSKTWCPLPWIFQAVRNNGDIRVCCQANTSESKGLLKKNDGTIYNATNDSLEEARNSPTLKEIRLKMLADEHPEACLRCQREDDAGVISRRNYETERWKDTINLTKAQEITETDGTINTNEVPAIYFDLRFGNLCNLKCRMCGPTDSNLWYKDQVKVWGPEFNDSHGKVRLVQKPNGGYKTENNDYDWVDSSVFWDYIKSNATNIRQIHTVGGEPLLIDQHYELLKLIIEHGNPKDVIIEYNTNLAKIPNRAWEIWPHFKEIRIGASIDGVGPVNDYIRHPSKWGVIESNLKRLDSCTGNFNIWIAMTVQAYNILHLPEFIKWKLQQGFSRVNSFSRKPFLSPHPLHNPNFLNVKLLPPSYKELVSRRFEEFFPWLDNWCDSNSVTERKRLELSAKAEELLRGYIRYMNSDDWSHLIPKFYKYTKKLDEIRGESFEDTFPELAQHIKESLATQNQSTFSSPTL